ncbi:uncharacterized protein LOC125659591 isoform X1 [Ostrea edulis]|uniref:uncharacterized protein LOC125659591 isoform X1 n=1 Tax=Ostrea edulis TaxID=37623 RepID=UPI0024AEB118|nr:uncharacterized protein LOC125659591 isoform X1 [Ostrea edulis]XP_056005418.1 uncharacterized protein LOC125659591 isoform X1 [Ostrea edulis]XP_056005419.1 uncharacterized protein LOC125659591 isoform X1 [Ostrea edulis]
MGSSGSKAPAVQISGTSDKDNPKSSPSKTAHQDTINVKSGGQLTNQKLEESESPSKTAPQDTNVKSGGQLTNQKLEESKSPSKTAPQDTNVNSGRSTSHQKPTESQSASQKSSDKQEAPKQAESGQLNKQVESEKLTEKPGPASATEEVTTSLGKDKENDNTETAMTTKSEGTAPGTTERLIPEVHKDQQLFDDAISSACLLIKSQSLMKLVTQNVTTLRLQRALPQGISLYDLLTKMTNLQDLDLSHNDMGPQAFRSICLAMCTNTSILCLNLSDNKTDTNSAECLGLMLSHNDSLSYLNVSNNNFGKDYFSRCVGPALKTNTSLTIFKAENIGCTVVKDFIAGLKENNSLTELDFSNNCVSDRTALGSGLAEILKRETCSVTSLALAGCEINKVGTSLLLEGVRENTSLTALNVNGLEFESLPHLLHFVAVAANNPNLQVLTVDGAKIKDTSTGAKGGGKQNVPKKQKKKKRCLLDTEEVSKKMFGKDETKNESQNESVDVDDNDEDSGEEGSDDFDDIVGLDTSDIVPPPKNAPPSLEVLSLIDSHLTDGFLKALQGLFEGRQIPLTEIDISSNNELTGKVVHFLSKLTKGEETLSTLRKLRLGVCRGIESLPQELMESDFPCLEYLNVRKSKITDLHTLSKLFMERTLTTLILDGQKIANTGILEKLLDGAKGSKLTTLSLGSCALSANDIKPLCTVIQQGLKLQMLKLSGNRLEDPGVVGLVEAISANKTHPLAVLDVSDNTFGDEGAKQIASLFTHKKHKTQLNSLNISHNDVGKMGLLSLVSVIGGKSPLRTLYLQKQTTSSQLTIPDMVEVFTKLAQCLGFTIPKAGAQIQPGSSDLPRLPEGLVVRLSELGGNTGDIGRMLDSIRIKTDYVAEKLPLLTFSDIQIICAVLKGSGSEIPVWSSEHWKMITELNRSTSDAPSWLELPGSRDLCLYLSNLPGSTTTQKLEAILEMDADCNLEEVCLMKDPVHRGVSGVGWALMNDEESIQKAVDFFISGEARVFGQSIIISRVKVKVDDDEDSVAAQKAREDQEMRNKLRRKEEQDLRRLIQRSTEESWKRHAYCLAHPAYADGRIW